MMKTREWWHGPFARLRGRAFVAAEGKMRTKTQSVAWRVVLVLFVLISSLGAGCAIFADEPSYSDEWTAAPGFVPQMPYRQLSENEHVNLYNGNLTIIEPIGSAISVGPDLRFQAHIRYLGRGSGANFAEDATRPDVFQYLGHDCNAGQWLVSYGFISPQVTNHGSSSYRACCTVTQGNGNEISYCAGLVYVDESGSQHSLYHKQNGSPSMWYAGDGSGVRAQFVSDADGWVIRLPGGRKLFLAHQRQAFSVQCQSGLIGYDVTEVQDRFGNAYDLSYDDSSNVTMIWDKANPSRYVGFTYTEVTPGKPKLLTSVNVPGVGGQRQTYSFHYFYDGTYRYLTQVAYPQDQTGAALSLVFDYYPASAGSQQQYCLKAIHYPTGGASIYEYAEYIYWSFAYCNPKTCTQCAICSVHGQCNGMGVISHTLAQRDGHYSTTRWDRYQMPGNFGEQPGLIKETLPDGQRVLHYCYTYENDDPVIAGKPVPVHSTGSEYATYYFSPSDNWDACIQYALDQATTVHPVRTVINTWDHPGGTDEGNLTGGSSLSPPDQNWPVKKTVTTDYVYEVSGGTPRKPGGGTIAIKAVDTDPGDGGGGDPGDGGGDGGGEIVPIPPPTPWAPTRLFGPSLRRLRARTFCGTTMAIIG
jgi:hypothetical protein